MDAPIPIPVPAVPAVLAVTAFTAAAATVVVTDRSARSVLGCRFSSHGKHSVLLGRGPSPHLRSCPLQ